MFLRHSTRVPDSAISIGFFSSGPIRRNAISGFGPKPLVCRLIQLMAEFPFGPRIKNSQAPINDDGAVNKYRKGQKESIYVQLIVFYVS